MTVKFKKNITIKGIQYLQGEEYTITQDVFDFCSFHVTVLESETVKEKPIEVKNKILTKKDVNKK